MAFTSIATTPGWADNAVVAAYNLTFDWAYHAHPMFEQFVDVEPDSPSSHGSSITMQIDSYFDETTVAAAADTALLEEVDVTPVAIPGTAKVTLTPTEHGMATISTLYLDNRGLVPVLPRVAIKVAQSARDAHDRMIQTRLRASTNVLRAGGRATTATVASTDTMTSALIRQAVTTMRGRLALPRDGVYYAGVLHPHVVHDLRAESGPGGWRTPLEYTNQVGGPLYTAEFGAWEGVRFMESTTVFRSTDTDGVTSTPVYRGFILGQEALAKAVVVPPTIVPGPQTDSLRRFVKLGWKSDLDFQVYRQEAVERLESAASIN